MLFPCAWAPSRHDRFISLHRDPTPSFNPSSSASPSDPASSAIVKLEVEYSLLMTERRIYIRARAVVPSCSLYSY